MNKYSIAHHHASSIWYCCWLIIRCFVTVVFQRRTLEQKQGSGSQDYSYSLCRQTWMCLMAEISARSSVSSLQSCLCNLTLGHTTLVAAFLNSSKRGSYVWYCSWSPGTPSSDRDIMIPDKEECWQHALDLLIQPLRWDKSPRHIVASSTLKYSASYTS